MQIKLKINTLWHNFVTTQRAESVEWFAIIDELYTLTQCHC